MTDQDLLCRFSRKILQGVTVPQVSARLIDAASNTTLDSYSGFSVGASPSLETARRIRKIPARWAAKVAGGWDSSAPDALEVLELLLKDPRLGVRRAIACAKGLPLEAQDQLMVKTLDADEVVDVETVSGILVCQDYGPIDVAEWLSRPGARRFDLPDHVVGRVVKVLRTDFDVVVSFVRSSARGDWVFRMLAESGNSAPHFVDVFDAIGQKPGLDGMLKLLQQMQKRFHSYDLRSVEWLAAHRDEYSINLRPQDRQLASLTDPDLIRAWWLSGIEGARASFFDVQSVSSPIIAETLATMPEVVANKHDATYVASCTVSVASTIITEDTLEDRLTTIRCALDLLEGVTAADCSANHQLPQLVTDAAVAIANLFKALSPHTTNPGVIAVFERLAELRPELVGPAMLTQALPVPGVAARVAADPVHFGVNGHNLFTSWNKATGPADMPWAEAPDLWAELVWNTPGVIDQMSRDYSDAPELSAVVAELLERALGVNTDAWDATLNLVPSWEGSIADLVGIAATFTDGVLTEFPTAAPAAVEPEPVEVPAPAEDLETDAATGTEPAVTQPEVALGGQLALL